MQREIKVRYVVRDHEGKVRVVEPLSIETIEQNVISLDTATFWTEIIDRNFFIGLKDKNGKEIYEADLLEQGLWIAWCEKCCSFELFMQEFGCMGCNGDIHWCEVVDDKRWEVIGNIYENPELLK